MSPRARVSAIVALVACLAAGAVVGTVLVQTRGAQTGTVGVGKPRAGFPPLLLDLGVRVDPRARALRQGLALYERKRYAAAARVFDRDGTVEGELGAAFARWGDGGLDRVKRVVAAYPESAEAELQLGIAYLWAGRNGDAAAAFRATRQRHPDTQSALDAADFLFPGPPGVPPFVPTFEPPAAVVALPAAQRLAALARAARRPDARAKLLYGAALQSLGRTVSAERQFAAAARLAPHDPQARVAAILGTFDKGRPQTVFPRLGPLVRVFPHAPTVRFHLGLALIWIGQFHQARTELRHVVREAPGSPLARQAEILVERLGSTGTK